VNLALASPLLAWPQRTSLERTTLSRSGGLTLTWSNGNAGSFVQISGRSVSADSSSVPAQFTCSVPAAAGQFTIPPRFCLRCPRAIRTPMSVQSWCHCYRCPKCRSRSPSPHPTWISLPSERWFRSRSWLTTSRPASSLTAQERSGGFQRERQPLRFCRPGSILISIPSVFPQYVPAHFSFRQVAFPGVRRSLVSVMRPWHKRRLNVICVPASRETSEAEKGS
jgi:hypothetical protein